MRGQMTHLDPDVLADFDAGLITGRRGARIAAHLAECERCRAVSEDLAGMAALFAAVPAPAMPDLLAQRLETALAAEVAHRDNPERAGSDPHAAPQPARRQARSPRFRLVALRVTGTTSYRRHPRLRPPPRPRQPWCPIPAPESVRNRTARLQRRRGRRRAR